MMRSILVSDAAMYLITGVSMHACDVRVNGVMHTYAMYLVPTICMCT